MEKIEYLFLDCFVIKSDGGSGGDLGRVRKNNKLLNSFALPAIVNTFISVATIFFTLKHIVHANDIVQYRTISVQVFGGKPSPGRRVGTTL